MYKSKQIRLKSFPVGTAEAREWGLDLVLDSLLSSPDRNCPGTQLAAAGARAPTALRDARKRPPSTPPYVCNVGGTRPVPHPSSTKVWKTPEVAPQRRSNPATLSPNREGRGTLLDLSSTFPVQSKAPTSDQLRKIAQQVQQSQRSEQPQNRPSTFGQIAETETPRAEISKPDSNRTGTLPPPTTDISELVARINALPKQEKTGNPMRIHLQMPGMREHFKSDGTLKDTSALYRYKGDTNLFSVEKWDYLCYKDWKTGMRIRELQRRETGL